MPFSLQPLPASLVVSGMKLPRLLFLTAFLALNPFAPLQAGPSPSERTAEYVKAHLDELRDQETSLDVAFIKAADAKNSIPGHVVYHAVTYDARLHVMGGTFPVVFPKEMEGYMIEKYGVLPDGGGTLGLKHPDTKKIKGWVAVSQNGHAVLDITGSAGAAIAKAVLANPGANTPAVKKQIKR
jgi:hypothetical protein